MELSSYIASLSSFWSESDSGSRSVIVTLSLVVLWYAWLYYNRPDSNSRLPPGPRGLPLVGNLLSLDPELHSYFAGLAHTYGPIYKLRLGTKLGIVITSPSLARQVLKDHDVTFANRDVPAAGRAVTYGGSDIVWTPYGPEWRMLRKVCVLKMLSNTTLDSVHELRRRQVRATVGFIYSRVGSPVDVGEQMFLNVLNVITNMLWGGTVQGEAARLGAEFRQVVAEMTALLGKPNVSDFYPGLARFDLQGVAKQMEGLGKRFDAIFERVIGQRLGMEKEGAKEESKDFLTFLLRLKDEGDSKTPLTMTHLKALLMDMVVGGTDTSSNTIEFAMSEVLNKPQVLQKVRQELEDVVGKSSIVEESHIHKLPYLYAVMKETLRLHPVLPLLVLKNNCGAGKTTLMDVLAGRKTSGYIEGSITLSGYPKKQETFARIAGYCEQTDILSPHVTVYESLVYSAWLRLLREVDSPTRKMFIEEVMELVEMTSISDRLVGFPGVNGLSTEQRKRLTIAVELVANPSIIFMDEPTSSLDARAAAIVMRTVRNTVDTGRTVVCTIHQPSIDIFDAFDEMLLLKRGGEEIYVGPLGHHASQMIEYFQGISGVSKIKDGYNPATWMLEVTSPAQEVSLGVDFAKIYKDSEMFRKNKALIKELSSPAPDSKDLYFSTRYSQFFFTQCMACLWKQCVSYWRRPQYTAVRLIFTAMMAVLLGSFFWDLGSKREKQRDLLSAMGSMYAAVLFIGIQNSLSVQPVVGVERLVSYRERAAGMYSAFPFAFGQAVIEIPYALIQSIIYGIIVYSMIGFEWTVSKFFYYLMFMYLTFVYFTFHGMMIVAITPNNTISAVVSSAF